MTEPTAPPRPVEEGKLVYLKLSELHPFHTFRPHPFKVRDDAKMQETVASIKLNGVMVPGLARPEKDGNGYEIVAGHRRCRGSELAGLEEMPFIVRDMTDHEAVEAMKDSNKQTEGSDAPQRTGRPFGSGGRGHQAPGLPAERCGRGGCGETLG